MTYSLKRSHLSMHLIIQSVEEKKHYCTVFDIEQNRYCEKAKSFYNKLTDLKKIKQPLYIKACSKPLLVLKIVQYKYLALKGLNKTQTTTMFLT